MIKQRLILSIKVLVSLVVGVGASIGGQFAWALDLKNYPRLQESVAPLIAKGIYTDAELQGVFANITLKEEVVRKKANAAEKVLTWGRGGKRGTGYRGIFIQQDRIEQGAQFWRNNESVMNQAKSKLGLNGAMISAIIGVETKFGQNKGRHLVLESIATHANRGSKLQFGQLPIFLTLVKQGHLDINAKGSYSGAMGIPQFISSSYRDFGIDFDNDNIVDLVANTDDAIGSVANYFKKHDWRENEPVMFQVRPKNAQAAAELKRMSVTKINSRVKPKTTLQAVSHLIENLPENMSVSTPLSIFRFLDENDEPEYFLGYHNFYVIMRYNHSALYARAVYQLSQEIAKAY